MTSVFDAWKTYERAVIPADAGQTQREECRRAFYAGAVALFGIVTNDAVAPDDETTCVANMEALDAELRAMSRDLRG